MGFSGSLFRGLRGPHMSLLQGPLLCLSRLSFPCCRYLGSSSSSVGSPTDGAPKGPFASGSRGSCNTPLISFWSAYVRGINPEYEPRKKMHAALTAQGICVDSMTKDEVNKVTLWLQQREIYGEKFPQFPHGISLEQKLKELKEKYPLKHK